MWLNPCLIYIGLLFIVLFAFLLDDQAYQILYGVPSKEINGLNFSLYLSSAALFLFGAKTAKKINCFVPKQRAFELIPIYKFLLFVTLSAYCIWFGWFIAIHGLHAFFSFYDSSFIAQNMYLFRNNSGRIGGLTTMTEIGVLVAPLSMFFFQQTKKKKYLIHLLILFLAAVVRARLFSERLAFLEIFIPVVCLYFGNKPYKKKYEFIPIYGMIIVFGIFACAEYARSWLGYYSNVYSGSFLSFVGYRIVGYYSVAVNTECTMLVHSTNMFFPFRLTEWIFSFPFVEEFLTSLGIHNDFGKILEMFGNVEYNNPGGLLVGIVDFGLFGIFISFFFGRIFGGIYKSYKQGYLVGMVLYPSVFLCLLELPRYFYFGTNRGFFVLVGMSFVFYKLKKMEKCVYG